MVYLLGCLPPSGCHTGALVRALGPHGKLVPLRNADLCSTAALTLIRSKSKQPKRLAPKSFQVQLKIEKMSAFVRLDSLPDAVLEPSPTHKSCWHFLPTWKGHSEVFVRDPRIETVFE